ncbi:hypothetical protein ASD77_02410 [Pseudoxanthomonas sp. Root65]|mgnify:CR=1 FL=1|jgi:hypothetical protein|uniref:DUF4124 domain-containing protein n=1 Tax=unclassified Pseudoxanthomonas TaxID=2645906 RepID=UPI0006F8535E|nr:MULTISPECIES: DUF4124 domain-containing protein [unclassified Pseudoxanthomonas]KRA53548.1 hypothetical protein ASD77_02410 [Pseudoxanthomonas sp. Root65]MCH6482353.1 DUF4124 domain-containing protein [Pseudoxanthomonas sp. LH2527]
MRAWAAIVAGIALGVGVAWWLARESPETTSRKQARAEQAAAAQADDARPSLYRWRDDAGVLQITEQPPKDRRYERIDRDTPAGIRVSGDAATDAD